MEEETSKKANPFVVRSKAACVEMWEAFKALSTDAKILLCSVLGILIIGICCTSTMGDSVSDQSETSAGSLLSDAKESIKESYREGLNKVKNDAGIKKDLQDVKDNCRKLGEASRELNDALQGLNF